MERFFKIGQNVNLVSGEVVKVVEIKTRGWVAVKRQTNEIVNVREKAITSVVIENPMSHEVCPKCGSTELYCGRTKDIGGGLGVVVDEDKIIGCHECDWEVDTTKSVKSIQVPKISIHSQLRLKIKQIKESKGWSTWDLAEKLGIDPTNMNISHLNPGHQGMVLTFKIISHEINNSGSLDSL